MLNALCDSLVTDLGLFEAGLLPADEVALAGRWLEVTRGVYDVVDARGGGRLTLADANGRHLDALVAPDESVPQPGETIVARAVPVDGAHLLTGGVVAVPAEQRAALTAWLDEAADARVQAAWVAELEGVAEPTTVDGEPMRLCCDVYALGDADAARRALDARYEPGAGAVWIDRSATAGGERWTRATLTITGSHLVVEANSAGRVEAVRAALAEAVGGLALIETAGARG